MTATCSIHNLPMTLVPAGISKKTGRRYNAFYGCPDKTCKETAPAPEQPTVTAPKPLTAMSEEEPMLRKDWDRKEFIKGFAVFTSNERSQGMSPVEVVKSSHAFDYMYVAYGDNPNYEEWAKGALERIKKLAGKQLEKDSEDIMEEFDKEFAAKSEGDD